MGLLDALQIGSSALLTHQAALQITGNNIANSATPGYSRQEPVLNPTGVSNLGNGQQTGAGVQIDYVRRIVDDALQERLNDASSQMHRYQISDQVLSRVESLMNEMTDTDISSAMVELFNSFSELAGSPQDTALRGVVLQRAYSLTDRMHFLREGLAGIGLELTDRLEAAVSEVDELASQIADLNVKVVAAESGGGSGASLRDERDRLLSRLSELVEVNTRIDSNGSASVYIGSEPLVFQGISRGVKMITQDVDGLARRVVAFADNDGIVKLTGGEIAGLQETRDGELAEIVRRTDELARQLIWQVNRIHSSGTALEGVSELTGTYQVDDFDVALDSDEAGLEFQPTNGSFLVHVTTTAPDGTRAVRTTQVNVPLTGGAGDITLNDLVAELSAIADVTASVGASGKLTVGAADANCRISFGEDSSGVLASLGLNTFFDGHDASTIEVNEYLTSLTDSCKWISAGQTGEAGDGSNAAEIALLADLSTPSRFGGVKLLDYQQRLTADTAVWASGARETASANGVVHESLFAQRESLSGVSLDEEAVNLMLYQRSFQAAARFITVVDELLQTLLSL